MLMIEESPLAVVFWQLVPVAINLAKQKLEDTETDQLITVSRTTSKSNCKPSMSSFNTRAADSNKNPTPDQPHLTAKEHFKVDRYSRRNWNMVTTSLLLACKRQKELAVEY